MPQRQQIPSLPCVAQCHPGVALLKAHTACRSAPNRRKQTIPVDGLQVDGLQRVPRLREPVKDAHAEWDQLHSDESHTTPVGCSARIHWVPTEDPHKYAQGDSP